MSRKAFPSIPARIPAAPSVAVTAPLLADDLYALMKAGFTMPVATVSKITSPKSIEMTDGAVLDDIDAIVYCTRHDAGIPSLPTGSP